MSARIFTLVLLTIAAMAASAEDDPAQPTGRASLQWFDDADAAEREAVASGRLVLAILSNASVDADPGEDPARARVQQLISSSRSLEALVSDSCVLLSQRCGPPDVLMGSRRLPASRLLLGVLDDQLQCYRLALGLPDDRWLSRAINDAILQRLIAAGVDTPAARTEILVTRALERLEPAWQAQVGGRGGELAESGGTDAGGADADAAGWRLRASLYWQNLSGFLMADLAARFGMDGDAADLQRLRSLAQHAETSAPMADAVLAIAPAAPWSQLSRSLAESLWPEGYWESTDPQSPLVDQIKQVVQTGQPVVLDVQDSRLDTLAGRASAFFARPADANEQRRLAEALGGYDVRAVDLRQLANLAVRGGWPPTDFVQPSPVRYIVLAPDQPPLVIRDNEHETRVRKKLESAARRIKNLKQKK